MRIYIYLYHAYNLIISFFLRVTVLIGSIYFIYAGFNIHKLPRIPIFILSILFISEVVYEYKLKKTKPNLSIEKNTGSLFNSCTLQALDAYIFSASSYSMVCALAKNNNIKFLFLKSNIVKKDIPKINISKDQVLEKARDLVKEIGGDYITSLDLCSAYLLITEPTSKLLFNKHIKPEEFIHILYWSRIEWPKEEHPLTERINFLGEGVFDNLTSGWTPETKKYITDITYSVLDKKPVLLGRKKEFHTLISALSKPNRNNVLLIGEVGVGKTSLVEALAYNSNLGLLPGKLYHQRVYELRINLLVAGIQDVGQLTTRLEQIMTEVSHAGNIILYIPNLENILGSSTFHLDLTGALIPYLTDGKIPFIATITSGAYKTYVEKAKVFADLFEDVVLEEPLRDEAIQMVLENANVIENQNKVVCTFNAIISSVDLSKRFIQDKVLPGGAITLLSSVASSVRSEGRYVVDQSDIIAKIEQISHGTLAAPGDSEKSLLLNLESKLHERIIGQDDAIYAISQAIRRVRSGVEDQVRPISFLFLGPTGVGKTESAKALASLYFGGEDKIIRLDMSEYTGLDAVSRLLGSAAGVDGEKGELTEKVFDHPFSLILLDEFEKAHPEVLDLFLQVLDDGRLTDSHGKKVSFANTIIIATSNAGALFIQEREKTNPVLDEAFQEELIDVLEKEHIFKPELLNRFDGIIVFKILTKEQIALIAQLYLKKLQKEVFTQKDIVLQFNQDVVEAVAALGFDSRFGARPLRRFIETKIEDAIAQHILDGKIQRGNTVLISINSSQDILVEAVQ